MKHRRLTVGLLSLALSCLLILNLSACNPATVQAYINLAVQIALQVAQLAGLPPVIVNQVSADLALVEKLITDYNAASASAKPGIASQIDTALNTAQADLNGILTAAHVVDPKLQATIRASIAIAITAVESIRTIALGSQPPAVAKAATATARVVLPGGIVPKPKAMTPTQLKNLYNSTVKDYPTAQLH